MCIPTAATPDQPEMQHVFRKEGKTSNSFQVEKICLCYGMSTALSLLP